MRLTPGVGSLEGDAALRTRVGVGVLVLVLVGIGYALHRARSGAGETPSGTQGTPAPKAPEASAPAARTLYVATPWAKLYSEPRPDDPGWSFMPLGARVDVEAGALSNGFISVKQVMAEYAM